MHVDRQGRTGAAVLFERAPKTHLLAVATVVFGPDGKLGRGPKLTEASRLAFPAGTALYCFFSRPRQRRGMPCRAGADGWPSG